MANNNTPFGLKPVRRRGGGALSVNRYYLPAGESNDLYIGDPVIIAGSGDANGVPTITKATAGTANRLTGAIVGFEPSASVIANGYRLASTAAYALVCDDPEAVYEIQATTAAATDIGANVNLSAATGNRLNQSRFSANGAQIATTATYQLRILGFSQREDNVPGQYAKILARINTPTETGAAGSTGV